jgi:adenylate kinase family enzyme
MSKPQTIIGLSGPAGSGKDTVADLLVTHCGFTKLAFADPLKNEVADAFCIEPLYLTRRETKEHAMSCLALRRCLHDGFTARMIVAHNQRGQTLDLDAARSPRQIMQWWGTDYRRHQAPDYWVSQTSSRIAYLLRERIASRIVVTDCRFDNEADLLRHTFGGLLWQVKRAGIDVAQGGHASEVTGEAFQPDATLHNDHDIRHLQQLVLGEFWAHDAGLEAGSLRVEIAA